MLPESARTAIKRSGKPSTPLKEALSRGLVSGPVLDWGSGREDDIQYLHGLGFEAYGYDPFWQPTLPSRHDFRYGQVVYVLNVLRKHSERVETLRQFCTYLGAGAKIMVAARSEKAIERASQVAKSPWTKVGSGYVTSKPTYQEGFTEDKLRYTMEESGLICDVTVTRRDTVYGFGHAI